MRGTPAATGAGRGEVSFLVTDPGGSEGCAADLEPPTVGITLPVEGTEVSPGGNGRLLLRAGAADPSGIREVDFWIDGVRVWTDGTSPYAHNWFATLGPHELTASARDECDNVGWSSPVTFTAVDPDPCAGETTPPVVSVTQPASGEVAELTPTGRVLLRAEAVAPTGIDRVEFWIDGALARSDASHPYAHNWLPTPGDHVLSAKAVDACGISRWSQAVSFSVADPDPCSGDDTAPSVVMTVPTPGEEVEPSATGRVLLRATAQDASGIDRVEFWVDGEAVSTDSTSPHAPQLARFAGAAPGQREGVRRLREVPILGGGPVHGLGPRSLRRRREPRPRCR